MEIYLIVILIFHRHFVYVCKDITKGWTHKRRCQRFVVHLVYAYYSNYSYDTKVHLVGRCQFWGGWYTPLLPLHPDPLQHRVVVPIRFPSMGQIDLGGSLLGIVANVLDCNFRVSEFKLTFTFLLIPLWKVWTPLSPQLWVE